MASPSDLHSPPVPDMPHPQVQPQPSDASSAAVVPTTAISSPDLSDPDADQDPSSRGRSDRPRQPSRKPSASILVPRDHPEIEIEEEEFPPDDARAMSPRRNSADLERLGKEARQTLQDQAKSLQSSLQALAERIEAVESDHDKLASENRFLQDYIGGLTRNMTKSEMSKSGGKGRKAQK